MDTVLDESTAARPDDYGRKKRRILAIMLGLAALVGVVGAVLAKWELNGVVWRLPSRIAIIVCVGVWCHYDARERDYPLGAGLRVLILLFLFVGFPVYAFRTRGWRGFGLIGLAIPFFLAVAAVLGGIFVVTEWALGS